MDRKSNEIVTTFAYHATLDFVWSIWMSWFAGILVHLHSVWNSSTKLTQIPTVFLGNAQDHLKKKRSDQKYSVAQYLSRLVYKSTLECPKTFSASVYGLWHVKRWIHADFEYPISRSQQNQTHLPKDFSRFQIYHVKEVEKIS